MMHRNVSASASFSSLSLQALRSQSFTPQPTPPPLIRSVTAPPNDAAQQAPLPSGSSAISSGSRNGPPAAAANSIFNKPISASLYQTCRSITDRLKNVPHFEMLYLREEMAENRTASQDSDPVNDLWRCFRLGASLCHLYNATLPDIELALRPGATTANLNACKAEVYHFLLACKNQLGFADEDLFTISELYSENTNGFVKVTKTVSLVLDLLQERELLIKRDDNNLAEASPEGPKDNKAKVIEELLETERKYVQYLEILQNYMRELQVGEVISADTSHQLFANLNALVDFQRRFLIAVETTCALPAEKQRIGLVFTNLEEAFSVYEPFCSNYTYAAELVIEETPKLRKLEGLVEPTYELPSLLIKPIQRICKYPLLLRELVRFSSKDDPFFDELEAGEASIKRVTDRVNETRRRQENEIVVMELERRVEDWKGHSVASFGALLLEDTFQVMKGDVEREYRVYLFERILLCCKESISSKKNSKSMSISKKPKKRASLQLKGRIFINNVTDILPISKGSTHTLQVYWRGDQDQEYFTLRCKNEENLKQWYSALTKLMEEARISMAEYRSNQTITGQGHASFSSNPLQSMHQLTLGSKDTNGYESDEESHLTEDTANDSESFSGSLPMSRDMSTNSFRSRATTTESANGVSFSRYNSGAPASRTVSSSIPKYLQSGMEQPVSQFSPSLDPESPYSTGRPGNSAGYPFPRTSYHDGDSVNGSARNTAPPMSRTGSRDSSGSRTNYALTTAGRQSNSSSAIQRPGMSSRTRSASSPNINGYPQRPGITIPEMPPPPMPSGGYAISPASSTKDSPSSSTKVKVSYAGDIFIILLPHDVGYEGLMERVDKKIRLCGQSATEIHSFRIRYKDEDGDLITISSNEDVLMALESAEEGAGVLQLYASANK